MTTLMTTTRSRIQVSALLLFCRSVISLTPLLFSTGAPVHVVMGMAGKNYQYKKTDRVLADWDLVLEEELGYTVIKASRDEFELDFFREKDGDKVDSFKIFKTGKKRV